MDLSSGDRLVLVPFGRITRMTRGFQPQQVAVSAAYSYPVIGEVQENGKIAISRKLLDESFEVID